MQHVARVSYWLTGILAALVIAGAVTAYASSSSSRSNSGAAAASASAASVSVACTEAKKEVASISVPDKFPSSLPKVKTSELKGKSIWAVFDDMTNPTDVVTSYGFKAAAAAVGAKVKIVDGQGTPSAQTDGVLSAVSAKPFAIFTEAIVASSITDGLAAAKRARVPVTMGYPGIPANAPGYHTQGAERQDGIETADEAWVETGCNPKAQFGLFTTPILTNMDVSTTEFSAHMKKICPGCRIFTQALSLTTFATQAGQDAVSMVQAHPGIKVLVSSIDPPLLEADPALASAGSKVKTIGMTANVLANDKYIKSGQETDMVQWTGEVVGWLSFDQLARQVAKAPAEKTWASMPFVVLNKADFSKVDPSLAPKGYETVFKKAWGVR